jgi:LacI family transcriptional regulator
MSIWYGERPGGGWCGAGHRLLDLPKPPTAILASNNKLLLGVLQAVEERKVAVPKDLSVLGFDDYVWNRHFNSRDWQKIV